MPAAVDNLGLAVVRSLPVFMAHVVDARDIEAAALAIVEVQSLRDHVEPDVVGDREGLPDGLTGAKVVSPGSGEGTKIQDFKLAARVRNPTHRKRGCTRAAYRVHQFEPRTRGAACEGEFLLRRPVAHVLECNLARGHRPALIWLRGDEVDRNLIEVMRDDPFVLRSVDRECLAEGERDHAVPLVSGICQTTRFYSPALRFWTTLLATGSSESLGAPSQSKLSWIE